jgi:ATP-dependent DNA helicase RecG
LLWNKRYTDTSDNRSSGFYTKGGKLRFVEGDPFVTIIPLPVETGAKTEASGSEKTTQKTTQKILGIIRSDPGCSRRTLAETIGISADGIKYHLRRLQQTGRLRRIGPDKGGHWEVVKE